MFDVTQPKVTVHCAITSSILEARCSDLDRRSGH